MPFSSSTGWITFSARFPGRAGNLRISLRPQLSNKLLVSDPVTGAPAITRIQEHDTVLVVEKINPSTGKLYDVVRDADQLALQRPGRASRPISSFDPIDDEVRLLTV